MYRTVLGVVVAVIALVASACGGSSSPDVPDALTVTNAWARPTPTGAPNGVVYLSAVADVDDRMTGASVPPSIAAGTTLHVTTMGDGTAASHHGDGSDGMMAMDDVDQIDLLAGKSVDFAPGANHIMLDDLAAPLVAGDRFPLTLEFASGRTVDADVLVADNPPG